MATAGGKDLSAVWLVSTLLSLLFTFVYTISLERTNEILRQRGGERNMNEKHDHE